MTEIVAWAGKTDGSLGPIEFDSLESAEKWIEAQEGLDPAGVHRGDYYIDSLTEE